jgi:hypothetical protein
MMITDKQSQEEGSKIAGVLQGHETQLIEGDTTTNDNLRATINLIGGPRFLHFATQSVLDVQVQCLLEGELVMKYSLFCFYGQDPQNSYITLQTETATPTGRLLFRQVLLVAAHFINPALLVTFQPFH